jgi:hypothetical protein
MLKPPKPGVVDGFTRPVEAVDTMRWVVEGRSGGWLPLEAQPASAALREPRAARRVTMDEGRRMTLSGDGSWAGL